MSKNENRKTRKIIIGVFLSLLLVLVITFYLRQTGDDLISSSNNTQQENKYQTEVGQIFSIEGNTRPQIGKTAPDFSFGIKQENEILLSSLQDEKPALISFWTTWCGACRAKMPHIQEIYDKYKQKLQILSINLQEDKETIKTFMENNDYSFPVYRDSGQLGQLYFVQSIPTAFFIDQKGIIRQTHTGLMTSEKIEESLEKIL